MSKGSIGNWARAHSCKSLTKNLAAFCLYTVNLDEAEFKSSGVFGGGSPETG